LETPIWYAPEGPEPLRTRHGVLLGLTLLATLLTGALLDPRFYDMGIVEQVHAFVRHPQLLLLGAPFALPLLFILGVHEMGHFLTARRYGIRVTWPYFIPGPPYFSLGTFGAFIRLKSPIPTRGALMEVGANGPFYGFIASVLVAAAGFGLLAMGYKAPTDLGVNVRLPLGFWCMRGLFTSNWARTLTLFPNPVLLAAWLGFFVQGLNLLPVGQLDGGHVLYAFTRTRHRIWSVTIACAFLAFALFHPEWLLWTALIFFVLGLRHPPCLDDGVPMTTRQVALGVAAVLIFILTFEPLPFIWTS
jgi:membrane-associated protease RseP (regulator of RpoE activity)